jgi:hypothetical protein
MPGEAVIVQSMSAWVEQGHQAYQALLAKVPEEDRAGLQLKDLDAYDHNLFASMIEALVALSSATGVSVGEDLVELAGLRPVGEVLGLP